MPDPVKVVIPAPEPTSQLGPSRITVDYDEAYRDGYIDALKDIQTLFAGFDDSIDEWIEEKLESNDVSLNSYGPYNDPSCPPDTDNH